MATSKSKTSKAKPAAKAVSKVKAKAPVKAAAKPAAKAPVKAVVKAVAKPAPKKVVKVAAKAPAKAAAKPMPRATTATARPAQLHALPSARRSNPPSPKWIDEAIALAQQNPAVSIVAIIAVVIGIMLVM